jgi:subtilisin family serine protease
LNTGSDTAASFSSRGTVTSDNSSRRKPDLAAPGTNVRSSIKTSNTSYANFNGTSMATPHIAGAVALLWSAQPLLRNNIEATEDILNESATPISANDCDAAGVIPNNTFGYGRLDAKAAVDVAFLTTIAPVITRQGTAVTLTFYAGFNRTYRLERKFDLTEAGWLPIPGVNDLVATSDGPAPLTDPDPNSDQAFYRVRLVQ